MYKYILTINIIDIRTWYYYTYRNYMFFSYSENDGILLQNGAPQLWFGWAKRSQLYIYPM